MRLLVTHQLTVQEYMREGRFTHYLIIYFLIVLLEYLDLLMIPFYICFVAMIFAFYCSKSCFELIQFSARGLDMGPITTHFAITCNNEITCNSKNWL